MCKALLNRLTDKMLWWLVIPSSALISALVIVAFSYAHVAWKANEVTYEGWAGKFTAKIDAAVIQVHNALALVDQQQIFFKQLEKSLPKIEYKAASTSQHQASVNTGVTASDLPDVITSLKSQSAILNDQKKYLTAISDSLQQFKQELKNYPDGQKK